VSRKTTGMSKKSISRTSPEANRKADWNKWVSILSLFVAVLSALIVWRSYEWTKTLSKEQMIPRIQVIPEEFKKGEPFPGYGAIKYMILNHSEFPAFSVGIDHKYSENDWLLEWNKARIKDLIDKGSRTLEEDAELAQRKQFTGPLMSLDPGMKADGYLAGAIPKNISDLAKPPNGFPISIRVTWRSKDGRQFESVLKYKLISTKVGAGETFSFLPAEER
jgi:hypothetical protein